ncbi:MAG: hypothetical protein JNM33_00120 [Rubrivivax sp.]|nr:hypothetical protein [Rubrivivax sp.]
MTRLLRRAFVLLGLLLAGSALAQSLDDVDVRPQGENRVVRIRFNASVGFVTLLPGGTSDLYTLRFEMLSADEPVLRQTASETRRLVGADGLPDLSVTYQPEPASRIKQLTVRLGRAMAVQGRQGPNARSLELVFRPAAEAVPAPAAAASAPPAPVPVAVPPAAAAPGPETTATPEVETEAAALMTRARAALLGQQPDTAITLLNQLLKLPPNTQSQTAQELIGRAWEQAGNAERARTEYALYLRLYPQGEGALRVQQKLAGLGGAPAPRTAEAAAPTAPPPPPKVLSGSIAQYYYGGKARSQSLVSIATGIDQATLSRTTESAIVTSFDLSARWRDAKAGTDAAETRAVLRGSGAKNLLKDGRSSSSVSAAYAEHRFGGGGAVGGLAVRAGRQSPISGGLLGLFDGISLVYPIRDGVKLDIMGGVPASALVTAPSERLFASVLEVDSFAERFGGNLYLLQQSTQGITNRRAIGAELRYAGERWSLNTLADYESVTKKLNALSVHGSFQFAGQTTLTLLADQRRAPSLQLTNALISSGAASLKELLERPGESLATVRQRALDTSATAEQFLVSVARPLSEKWQMSTDLRWSQVGALPAVGDFAATPATGAQVSWSGQLTGTNLYSKRDINNFNLSVITTPAFKGVQFSINNLTGWAGNDELTIEPSLRLYRQTDQQDVSITRIGPGLRLSWRASRRASLLGELLYETSKTRGPSSRDDSNSTFFYVGYRYELF